MRDGIVKILEKKRDGKELTWEEVKEFVKACQDGTANHIQVGAFLMACHVRGLSDSEVELFMRALMFSGRLMKWPGKWVEKMASLQTLGSTSNKAKLILAPAMAACGLKFPIISARGYDAIGAILNKLGAIPGFDGLKSVSEIEQLLADVGCCVVQQPPDIAPAERVLRDLAAVAAVSENDAFKEACIIARVAALKLHVVVIDIPFGPGEWLKTRDEAVTMAGKLDKLAQAMCIKARILVTHVDWPVGKMMGQSLEIAEAVRCLNGLGPADFHSLVCKLGGHILFSAGVAADPDEGQKKVHRVIRDGHAKRKFGQMLRAQGVSKKDVKSLLKARKDECSLSSVLPATSFMTHLTTDKSGFVHNMDMKILSEVLIEVLQANAGQDAGPHTCAGGIQIVVSMGTHLNTGEVWAKMHHQFKLDPQQKERLRHAVILKQDIPLSERAVDVREYHEGELVKIRPARLSVASNMHSLQYLDSQDSSSLEETPEVERRGSTVRRMGSQSSGMVCYSYHEPKDDGDEEDEPERKAGKVRFKVGFTED